MREGERGRERMRTLVCGVALALTVAQAWAYTPEQDKIIPKLQGAYWAAQNCKGLAVNTIEVTSQLGDVHLLNDKSIFDEIKKLVPEIDKVLREIGADACQLLWYQYGSNGSIPTKGKLLFKAN